MTTPTPYRFEEPLNPRERQAFFLFGHGLTTREVAQQMNIAMKTAETYRDNIKSKLYLSSFSQLIHRATLAAAQERNGVAK